jgi:hypothetical protein
MDVQVQRGRSPLVLRADTVMLKRIAGVVGDKGGVPGVSVISVIIGIRIVIH